MSKQRAPCGPRWAKARGRVRANGARVLSETVLSEPESLVDPDELAGLACEEGVASRLATERSETRAVDHWEGPFAEHEFENLPESNWCLSVFGVERHIPAVASVLATVCHLARLKLYAVSSVEALYTERHGGPEQRSLDEPLHLLQLQGSQTLTLLSTASGVRQEALEVHPGHAVALTGKEESVRLEARCSSLALIVYSRTPAVGDMIESFLNTALLAGHPVSERRFRHSHRAPDQTLGTISSSELSAVHEQLTELVNDEGLLREWLASFMSLSHQDVMPAAPENEIAWEGLVDMLQDSGYLARLESSRLVFVGPESTHAHDSAATSDAFGKLAINGQVHECRLEVCLGWNALCVRKDPDMRRFIHTVTQVVSGGAAVATLNSIVPAID